MKSKLLALFLVALVVSCNRQEDLKTKNSNNDVTSIGIVGSNGVHTITADQDQLKATIALENHMTKVDVLRVYTNEKNLTILEARGPIKGGKYLTVAQVLTVKNGKTMRLILGCKQSCTSILPCNGCDLTIYSSQSGSCSCGSGSGGCTHTVECDS